MTQQNGKMHGDDNFGCGKKILEQPLGLRWSPAEMFKAWKHDIDEHKKGLNILVDWMCTS